jgi:chorismate dehydratase
VLCSAFWRVSPTFVPTNLSVGDLKKQKDPFLLFGDACLSHYSLHTTLPSIDLCEAWHKVTKKSFIFAVLATRNTALQNNSWEIVEFHRKVEEAFLWSEMHRQTIIVEAAKKVGCSEPVLSNYFQSIEYRLTPRHFHGFHHFATLEESLKTHEKKIPASVI